MSNKSLVTDAPSTPSRQQNVYLAAMLVLLGIIVYLPAMNGGFIWDDDAYLTKNAVLKLPDALTRVWFEPTSCPQYYPLVFTTFWVEYQLWGLRPLGYHLANVLLHAVNAILLWQVLRRLNVRGAWWAAALFVVHPVFVESVGWVTERKNVLSTLFYLSAALAFFAFWPPQLSQPSSAAQRKYYVLALLLFVAALLSKTVTCSLPAALLLVAWWKRGWIGRRDLLTLAPMFALGVAFAIVTVAVERHHGAVSAAGSRTLVERILVAGRALWFYVGKLVWPTNLSFMYERWTIDARVWWQHVYPAAAVGTAALLWFARRHIGRGPLVAFLFFGGTLLPALGIIEMYMNRYSFVADHLQYLPSIGLLALAASGGVMLFQFLAPGHEGIRAAAGGVVLVVLGILTWRQGGIYKNEEVLWTDTIAKNPACWMAHNNLGNVYGRQGLSNRAMNCYLESLRLNPDHAEALSNLAVIQGERGDLENAISNFTRALRLDPRLVQAHYHCGVLLARLGKLADAESHFVEILRLDPDMPYAHLQLGSILEQQGNLEGAVPHLTRAAGYFPQNGEIRYTLAMVLLRLGRTADALYQSREAVRLLPGVARCDVQLAYLLQRQGQREAAKAAFHKALILEPSWPSAFAQEAWRLATDPNSAGRNGRLAVYLAEAACDATENEDPRLLDIRAAALAECGRFAEAAETAELALRRTSRQTDLAGSIRARLSLYKEGKPFRQDTERPR